MAFLGPPWGKLALSYGVLYSAPLPVLKWMVEKGVSIELEEVQFARQQVREWERGGEVDVWLKGLGKVLGGGGLRRLLYSRIRPRRGSHVGAGDVQGAGCIRGLSVRAWLTLRTRSTLAVLQEQLLVTHAT